MIHCFVYDSFFEISEIMQDLKPLNEISLSRGITVEIFLYKNSSGVWIRRIMFPGEMNADIKLKQQIDNIIDEHNIKIIQAIPDDIAMKIINHVDYTKEYDIPIFLEKYFA